MSLVQKHDRHDLRELPPLESRLAAGRPVMTREQLLSLAKRVVRMTTFERLDVTVTHMANFITRLSNDRVLFSDDGETIRISFNLGEADLRWGYSVDTNQLDDSVLLAGVQRLEAMVRGSLGFGRESFGRQGATTQDTPVTVQHWHEATVQAMQTARGTVIPELLNAVASAQLKAAGFLGLMARAEGVISKQDGIVFFHEETDSEVTVTARSRDGKRSGWGGRAARDWSTVPYQTVAQEAIRMATLCGSPVAYEPGRRTAILTPEASIQILRYLSDQFDADQTNIGATALSKTRRGGNKLGQHIIDPRLTMTSDPADTDGGYCPYFQSNGQYWVATPSMSWVDQGVLSNLAYNVMSAMGNGKKYATVPRSLRLSGGPTTLAEMIASCEDGIYVNRFSNVELLRMETGMTTGVTSDGCFLVKDGKMTKAVKNFRFLESPFFFLNKIVALGTPVRAAFGYTPQGGNEVGEDTWPRPPIIAPPMMVKDFNFNALSDAI